MGNTPRESFKCLDVSNLAGADGNPAETENGKYTTFPDGWEDGPPESGDRAAMNLSDVLVTWEEMLTRLHATSLGGERGTDRTVVGPERYAGFGWSGPGLLENGLFSIVRSWCSHVTNFDMARHYGGASSLYDETMSPNLDDPAASMVKAHVRRTRRKSSLDDDHEGRETYESESFDIDDCEGFGAVAGIKDLFLDDRVRLGAALEVAIGLRKPRGEDADADADAPGSLFPGYDDRNATFPTGGFIRHYGENERRGPAGGGFRDGELGLGEPEGMSTAGPYESTRGTQPLALCLAQLARLAGHVHGVAMAWPVGHLRLSAGPVSRRGAAVHFGNGAGDGGVADFLSRRAASSTSSGRGSTRESYDDIYRESDGTVEKRTTRYSSSSSYQCQSSTTYHGKGRAGAGAADPAEETAWVEADGAVSVPDVPELPAGFDRADAPAHLLKYLFSFSATDEKSDTSGRSAYRRETEDREHEHVDGVGMMHDTVTSNSSWGGKTNSLTGSARWSGSDRPFLLLFMEGNQPGDKTLDMGVSGTCTRTTESCTTSESSASSTGGSSGGASPVGGTTTEGGNSWSVDSCIYGSFEESSWGEEESWEEESWGEDGESWTEEPWDESEPMQAESWPEESWPDDESGSWWAEDESSSWWAEDESGSSWGDGKSDGWLGAPYGWPIKGLVADRGVWGASMDDKGTALVAYRVSWSYHGGRHQSLDVNLDAYNATGTAIDNRTETTENGSGLVVLRYGWRWDPSYGCGAIRHPALDYSFAQRLVSMCGGNGKQIYAIPKAVKPAGSGEKLAYKRDMPEWPEDSPETTTRTSYDDAKQYTGRSGSASVTSRVNIQIIGIVVFGMLNKCPH